MDSLLWLFFVRFFLWQRNEVLFFALTWLAELILIETSSGTVLLHRSQMISEKKKNWWWRIRRRMRGKVLSIGHSLFFCFFFFAFTMSQPTSIFFASLLSSCKRMTLIDDHYAWCSQNESLNQKRSTSLDHDPIQISFSLVLLHSQASNNHDDDDDERFSDHADVNWSVCYRTNRVVSECFFFHLNWPIARRKK